MRSTYPQFINRFSGTTQINLIFHESSPKSYQPIAAYVPHLLSVLGNVTQIPV